MSRAQSDVSEEKPGAGGGRGGETILMNPAMLGQAVNANPESAALRQLDVASAMLGQVAGEEDLEASINLDEYPVIDPPGPAESTSAEPTIEEYMAALIARTKHGKSDELPAVSVVAAVTPDYAVADVCRDESALEAGWTQSSPPECRMAISELRELANISARSSFNVHRGQQLVYEMHNKLTVALVALVVSFALTSLAGSMQSPTFYAAIVALITAIAWSLKYFQLGQQLSELCLKHKPDEDWQPQ